MGEKNRKRVATSNIRILAILAVMAADTDIKVSSSVASVTMIAVHQACPKHYTQQHCVQLANTLRREG